MSDHQNCQLVSIKALQLLSKMCDYQKNVYASQVLRELANMEPEFIALFGFQDLLKVASAKKAVLNVMKAYVDKQEFKKFE